MQSVWVCAVCIIPEDPFSHGAVQYRVSHNIMVMIIIVVVLHQNMSYWYSLDT